MTVQEFLVLAGFALIGLNLVMALAWAAQQRTGNSGWIDAGWSLGMGLAGAAGALLPLGGAMPSVRQFLVAGLAAAWALRLGLHIAARNHGMKDDPRYAKLAAEWGASAPRRMFWFAQQQAYASTPLALTIILAARNPAPGLDLFDALGTTILAIAVWGERTADIELRRFKADPANKGKVCDVGLWALSRHPNYFFEWLGWLAYPLFAIRFSGAYPFGFVTLIAPVLMYLILRYASGVPPLEKHMLESRGEAFRAYQRRTSVFFPWLPRHATGTSR